MTTRSLVVVMPAYNEQEGIGGFISELADFLRPHVGQLQFIVVDDRSTDGTVDAVRTLARSDPSLAIVLVENTVNRGHGPTALAAYRAGLELEPDLVLHVDGDGQFLGQDMPAVLAAIDTVDAVHGVRRGRTDPWFRKALSTMVRGVVFTLARRSVSDVNTPLRLYRPAALRSLLERVPESALVPHVHFSILEDRMGVRVAETDVRSIPRRAAVQSGTMWGEAKREPRLPPKKLVQFARRAIVEVWRVDVRGRIS
jgi:dolichol-phosphate mannosyltransferase